YKYSQFGSEEAFVILGAASIDVTVAHQTGEWLNGPLAAVHGHYVGVRHQQKRAAFAAVAAQPRDEVQAAGIAAQQLGADAVGGCSLLQVFGSPRFVAGRARRVDAEQVEQVLPGPLFQREVVLSPGVARGRKNCNTEKSCENPLGHAASIQSFNRAADSAATPAGPLLQTPPAPAGCRAAG